MNRNRRTMHMGSMKGIQGNIEGGNIMDPTPHKLKQKQ